MPPFNHKRVWLTPTSHVTWLGSVLRFPVYIFVVQHIKNKTTGSAIFCPGLACINDVLLSHSSSRWPIWAFPADCNSSHQTTEQGSVLIQVRVSQKLADSRICFLPRISLHIYWLGSILTLFVSKPLWRRSRTLIPKHADPVGGNEKRGTTKPSPTFPSYCNSRIANATARSYMSSIRCSAASASSYHPQQLRLLLEPYFLCNTACESNTSEGVPYISI